MLSRRYAYAGGFAPIQVADPTGPSTEVVYDIHTDHLDTPRMLTDASEASVWRQSHESFGAAAVDPASSVAFNTRFPGQYFDGETGLHYNRFRYFDPSVGRYNSSDPIGQLGDFNVYRYVRNSPTNSIDPTGLDPFFDCFKANYGFAFGATNNFFFGGFTRIARTGVGAITGGAVARTTGGLTVVQAAQAFWRYGVGGLATLGTTGTIAAALIGTATNAALSTAALEAGIVVGSAADALGQSLAGNCVPPSPGGCDDEDGDEQQ